MTLKRITLMLAAVILTLLFNSASKKDMTEKEFIKLYQDYYMSSTLDSIRWDGSTAKCIAGTLHDSIYTKAENRINFFRMVNQLPKISIDKEYNAYPQEAALMMHANNQLSHYPTKNWKCFTENGYEGATKSCLSLSNFKYFKDKAFVTGFIEDHGDANYYCGHRRWLLYSKASKMAYGATGKAEAVYILHNFHSMPDAASEFIAYPWNGYVPYHLIPSKWSFSIPEGKTADFKNIKLSITDEKGKSLPYKLFDQKKDFLDHTITWKMTSLFTEDEERYGKNNLDKNGYIGKTITVTIKDVIVDNEKKTYQYKFKIIKTPDK